MAEIFLNLSKIKMKKSTRQTQNTRTKEDNFSKTHNMELLKISDLEKQNPEGFSPEKRGKDSCSHRLTSALSWKFFPTQLGKKKK